MKPLVPLAAAIIGGLIAAGSAYLIQSETADLTLRLQQEDKEERTRELYRTKLEQALTNVKAIAIVAACLTLAYEKQGSPARCPITMETVVEAGALIEVYGSEALRSTAINVKNSYYEMQFFLDSQEHRNSMDRWRDDDIKKFKMLMDDFDYDFGGFAEALVIEIKKHISTRSAQLQDVPSDIGT